MQGQYSQLSGQSRQLAQVCMQHHFSRHTSTFVQLLPTTCLFILFACRPQRFLEMPALPSPYMYPAFNAGPRICLGKALAELEGVYVLVRMVLCVFCVYLGTAHNLVLTSRSPAPCMHLLAWCTIMTNAACSLACCQFCDVHTCSSPYMHTIITACWALTLSVHAMCRWACCAATNCRMRRSSSCP